MQTHLAHAGCLVFRGEGMERGRRGAWLPLRDDPQAFEGPRYVWLYRQLREAILEGGLKAQTRMPSSRTLAEDLGLSRTTVEEALRKLEGEGFITRRVGDGTYVSLALPQPFPARRARRVEAAGPTPGLSRRGQLIIDCGSCPDPLEVRPFQGGQPATEAFPYELWHRLLVRRSRTDGPDLLGYGDSAGYLPLRQAIAEYLISSRGVRCRPEDVLVLTSSQQALELASRVLLDPGEAAWIEEPGYLGARAALTLAGARLVPVPVDGHGLDVGAGLAMAPQARLVYTTPSHQYPLGSALSLERRLELLAWARRTGAWILEDDYDSEFRYNGRPLAAIQGLEPATPVIYIGTFTKALFPSLRLAYLVAPPQVLAGLRAGRIHQDGHPPSLMQAVLADFLHEGHFHTHLRKMRALYQARRDHLVEALATHCGKALSLGPSDAGLHVSAFLGKGGSDEALAERARAKGLELPRLSTMYLGPGARQGLVLGFSALAPHRLQKGARLLGTLL